MNRDGANTRALSTKSQFRLLIKPSLPSARTEEIEILCKKKSRTQNCLDDYSITYMTIIATRSPWG